MKLLAITCYTGPKAWAQMTRVMLDGLVRAFEHAGVPPNIYVVAQGADAGVGDGDWKLYKNGVNKGFAHGMNAALGYALINGERPDAVLCINNDTEIRREDWLKVLIEEGGVPDQVAVPTTNYTGQIAQSASGWEDRDAFDLSDTPAVCWLLPWSACEKLFETSGGTLHLFRQDLGMAWGEDTFAAAMLRRHWRKEPFRVVPRAWLFHHGAVTSSRISGGVKMASYRKARKLIGEE